MVAPKNTSVTSFVVSVSPSTTSRYSTLDIRRRHTSGFCITTFGSLKALHSWRTADFVKP